MLGIWRINEGYYLICQGKQKPYPQTNCVGVGAAVTEIIGNYHIHLYYLFNLLFKAY